MSDVIMPATPDLQEAQRGREERLRHDVRQSVSAVLYLAATVERDPLRGPEIAERLELMHHELDWIARTIQADDEVEAHACTLDAGDVVADTWAASRDGRCCAMRLVRDASTPVLADPDGLRRSVRNLIDNAVRAAGPDGHVEVRAGLDGDEVVVEVADDGPGFGQVPAQEGLGLVTVRRFARRWGGSLHVAESPGGGALVTLRLPRATDSLDSGRIA